MVNIIMRGGEETETMARNFMMAKYSHCPLKKRPIQIIKEENFEDEPYDDNSEPENLSTKPEDLSRKAGRRTPPPVPPIIPSKKFSRNTASPPVAEMGGGIRSAHSAFISPVKSSGPLEPLNLNTQRTATTQPPSPSRPWPRAVPAQYPPHYVRPLNFAPNPYPGAHVQQPPPPVPTAPELLPPAFYYSSPPPAAPPQMLVTRDDAPSPYRRAISPPRHAFAPFRSSHVSVISSVGQCKYRVHGPQHSPIPPSPTSTTSTSSYPPYYPTLHASPSPASPQDLSSPGSVSSNGGETSGYESLPGSAAATTTMAPASKKVTTKSTNNPPRYSCQFCNKSYSTYSGLSKHQQFHCTANEDPALKKKFKCKNCDKEYNSLGALKMHIRTHTLPCKCDLCGKAFSRPWLLQGHIRTHTGEKPFSCTHCHRAFADRSNLRAHLQTHSDVKKYSCQSCSKTFSRMSLLTKHNEGGCAGIVGGAPPAMVHPETRDVEMKYYYA